MDSRKCFTNVCYKIHSQRLNWNEVSDKLAKQGALKSMSETSYSNLLLSSYEIISILEKNVYKQTEKKTDLQYLLVGGI